MSQKNIIFNADDLGMSAKIDHEILSAARSGLVQSASVSVVNGLDSDQFKRFLNIRQPLKLGLHINLTEGRPLSSFTSEMGRPVSNQVAFKAAIELLSDEKKLKEEALYEEMKAQLARFIHLSGVKPSHIDSHQHYTYLSPTAFRAFLKLAKSENLKIRSPLSFIDRTRLQLFVESVKMRYGITIPFTAEERSRELRDIFNVSRVEMRTADCLIEIPSRKDLEKRHQSSESVEVVCHPHNKDDKEELISIQGVLG